MIQISYKTKSGGGWTDVPLSRTKRAPHREPYKTDLEDIGGVVPRPRPTPEEEIENSIRKYLEHHTHEELTKILNNIVTENVIEA